jgi:general secretion pathway protein K
MSINDDRVQADALVTAALELTAYRLTSFDVDSRPSRGDFVFRLGRANVAVEFRSETARVDLNSAPKDLLAGLFAGLGVPSSAAGYYADRIIAWRSPRNPDGPDDEPSAYRNAGMSYGPRQAPFAHVGELGLVLGMPPALVERAMPFVTVFSGRGEVNVLDAAPEVVAAIPGMTPDRLYAVLSQRGTGPQNAQFVQRLLGQEQPGVTTEASKAIRVAVRVDFDKNRRTRAEAVILLLDDSEEPFRVLSWRDDFDGPD